MTHYENVPEELKILPHWVCADKDTKAPMLAHAPYGASLTDPNTWTTFDNALAAVKKGRRDYCGFVFADNGYIGIDIDVGFDELGLISELAADIINICKSYTEESRSGRGFHVILKGNLPFSGRNNLRGVEIYRTGRYFIMTGNVVMYKEIIHNQNAIDYVIKKYFNVENVHIKNNENIHAPKTYKVFNPRWKPICDNSITLRPEYPTVTTGCRNVSMTSLAGQLHSMGFTRNEILRILKSANRHSCKPPLDNKELETICKSIMRYKN